MTERESIVTYLAMRSGKARGTGALVIARGERAARRAVLARRRPTDVHVAVEAHVPISARARVARDLAVTGCIILTRVGRALVDLLVAQAVGPTVTAGARERGPMPLASAVARARVTRADVHPAVSADES